MERINLSPLSFIDADGNVFYVNDIIKGFYDDTFIICFGFFDNEEDIYDGWESGCGFYRKQLRYIENKWCETPLGECSFGVISIKPNDVFRKETNIDIINQIHKDIGWDI